MKTGLSSSRIPYIAACGGKTWNVVEGCTNDGSICAVRARGLCWAEGIGHDGFKPRFNEDCFGAPFRARKPATIFTGFRTDLWCSGIDPECWREEIFDVEANCPQHIFVHLTKRPEKIRDTECLHNQWIGASICNEADEWKQDAMYELCLRIPSKTWLSYEPILGPILPSVVPCSFVVVGGLSDGTGRVLRPDEGGTQASWIQPIIDAAYEGDTPCFLKNLQPIIRELVDPRTGTHFSNQNQMRTIPEEWVR